MTHNDWTLDQVTAIYEQPLLDLVFEAQQIHRQHHDPRAIQRCTLLSIKTGGCPEDCGYCPQSAHYEGQVDREGLMPVDDVLAAARRAKDSGASRFCMGAAWRSAERGERFERVLEMVRGVSDLGLEVCTTLGMLDADQAHALKDAGLTAYNHNLDTSRSYYSKIISTRTYQDRLDTLRHVADAGISACCGGIVGMGESRRDRCAMLATLACFDPHPESVPINMLVPAPGTPLADMPPIDPFEVVRSIATARRIMPRSRIRLSAGRTGMSREAQAMCFMAGANSIFFGDKLLTTQNPEVDEDLALLEDLGLTTV